ncbi:DUF4158 domain-containing protein [Longispora albida]|uniref:DUF4158 domain-containing protein n=1 Tax=Longispora albida TaxID=203523 RepID=UPI0012F8A101|nr:DUF4158 domain-containing protein [Longispora albida]
MTFEAFSEEDLERLRRFPEINKEELYKFFTLTPADEAFLGKFYGPSILGVAVQLCSLPWLGFVPDDVSAAPPAAVARLAERLGGFQEQWLSLRRILVVLGRLARNPS